MIDWTQVKTAEDKAAESQEVALLETKAARAAAYTAESDPMFFKWQAGEITDQEWLAKREEIRARYPYPQD